MALMNMEEIITLQGVLSLKDKLKKFTAEAPPWPESQLNRISEIATNLGNVKLVEQAEQILLRYKEVWDMLHKREETLIRAEERLQVLNELINFDSLLEKLKLSNVSFS